MTGDAFLTADLLLLTAAPLSADCRPPAPLLLQPQSVDGQPLGSSRGLTSHLSRSLARMQQEGSGHGSLDMALSWRCVEWVFTAPCCPLCESAAY